MKILQQRWARAFYFQSLFALFEKALFRAIADLTCPPASFLKYEKSRLEWQVGGHFPPPHPLLVPTLPPTAEWSNNVWRVVLYLPQIPHLLSLCFDICTVFHSRWSLLLAINAKVQKKGERPPTVCISNLFGMWWRNDWHLFDYGEKWLESLLTLL